MERNFFRSGLFKAIIACVLIVALLIGIMSTNMVGIFSTGKETKSAEETHVESESGTSDEKSSINMVDVILKKKAGEELSEEEIRAFVKGAADGSVPDYQLSALLMAIYFQGMTDEETTHLTMEMMNSGSVVDLSEIDGICVDKHSTGGVGDTTTLVLVPLVAACGGKVAKLTGRGLGHTGGTIDKLESIPGCSVDLTQEEFVQQVKEIGCAVIGQTQDLCPADKALYALRDVTGTVDSIPLAASSIVSKKLASGADAIVLDVKAGSGAVMHTLEDSIELARVMVAIGDKAGKPILALVTGMDQPLGTHVGNALEVKEAIDILSGRTEGDLLTVSLELGSRMLVASGIAKDVEDGKEQMMEALKSGAGLEKFKELIEAQGGDSRVCDDVSLLPQAEYRIDVPATKSGYVSLMDTMAIGYCAQDLGAGRKEKTDVIDPAVGMVMNVRLGDWIEKGESLATLYVNKTEGTDDIITRMQNAITISEEEPELPPLIYATVSPEGVTVMD